MRRFSRVRRLLCAQIVNADAVPQTEKLTSLNLSLGGVFLVTCSERHQIGQKVSLLLFKPADITERVSVSATVRWEHKWGESLAHLPGIGVEFDLVGLRGRELIEKWVQEPSD